jgi:hypothetical protein
LRPLPAASAAFHQEEKLLAALACAASFEKSKLKSKLKSLATGFVLYLTAAQLWRCVCVFRDLKFFSSSSGVMLN